MAGKGSRPRPSSIDRKTEIHNHGRVFGFCTKCRVNPYKDSLEEVVTKLHTCKLCSGSMELVSPMVETQIVLDILKSKYTPEQIIETTNSVMKKLGIQNEESV